MHFTLRQRQHWMFLVALWVLLTVLCVVAGPFGTGQAMAWWGLASYWGFVVGVSILGSEGAARLPQGTAYLRIAVWSGYALVLAGVVFGVNALLFPTVWALSDFLPLLGSIAVSVLVIQAVIYLATSLGTMPVADTPTDHPDPQAKFLRRVPLEMRGPLVRIEAQDHYLNVVTAKGHALILLRLTEAIEELAQVDGLQTHRSHWVKLDAVTGHARVQGRDVLHMSDGARIPVARSKRDAARAAGLF